MNQEAIRTPGDSREDTLAHIRRVQDLMEEAVTNIVGRELAHDASKLLPPEKEGFDAATKALKGLSYGTPEYKAALDELRPTLQHHYRVNDHHPEHWINGILDMSLFSLVEMLCDWKAAGERHADGSIEKSLRINRTRFKIPMPLFAVLCHTAFELKWLDAHAVSRLLNEAGEAEKAGQ